jgi:hypothetical protein
MLEKKAGLLAFEPRVESASNVGGSNRSFGLLFAAIFAIIGLWPLLWRYEAPRPWALIGSGLFLGISLLAPGILEPLKRWWMLLALLLSRVMTPVIMGLLFVVAVLPTGLIIRVMGKDPMRLRRQPDAKTYWIVRNPPGPDPKTMTNQF